MEPRIIIDEKKLSAILASLSKICKGKLRFLEDGSQYYINSDRRNLPFCRILSRSPGSNALCTRCNETANARCRESRTFHCYFCHASLVEMMYPVIFEGRYLGNVNIGQFRSRTRTADAAFFDEMSRLTGSSAELLKKPTTPSPSSARRRFAGPSCCSSSRRPTCAAPGFSSMTSATSSTALKGTFTITSPSR